MSRVNLLRIPTTIRGAGIEDCYNIGLVHTYYTGMHTREGTRWQHGCIVCERAVNVRMFVLIVGDCNICSSVERMYRTKVRLLCEGYMRRAECGEPTQWGGGCAGGCVAFFCRYGGLKVTDCQARHGGLGAGAHRVHGLRSNFSRPRKVSHRLPAFPQLQPRNFSQPVLHS